MTIPLTKPQFNLLSKRNSLSEDAAKLAQAAMRIAQAERAAFEDIISCLSADAGSTPGQAFTKIEFGERDGAYFLELTENN